MKKTKVRNTKDYDSGAVWLHALDAQEAMKVSRMSTCAVYGSSFIGLAFTAFCWALQHSRAFLVDVLAAVSWQWDPAAALLEVELPVVDIIDPVISTVDCIMPELSCLPPFFTICTISVCDGVDLVSGDCVETTTAEWKALRPRIIIFTRDLVI